VGELKMSPKLGYVRFSTIRRKSDFRDEYGLKIQERGYPKF
jgi:hypothetical protein